MVFTVFAMKLIVDGYGVFVGIKNGMILIRGDEEREIPVGNVEQVVITTKGVSISSAFLRIAFKNNLDVIVLDSNGSPLGRFMPFMKKANVKVRKEQYKAQEDERGAFLARSFARGKIMNQYYLLKSIAKNRKRKDVLELCYGIKERAERVSEFNTPERIIQEEAKAAEMYWEGIAEFYEFEGRKKRYDNPTDPLNVMLNYGYSVLMSYVWLALELTCLDVYAGFLHAENPKRPALVVDLMEEFRQPVVDRAVFRVRNAEVKDGKLSAKTRRELMLEIQRRLNTKVTFENRKLPIEYHMYLQARRIERFLLGKGRYSPFILR